MDKGIERQRDFLLYALECLYCVNHPMRGGLCKGKPPKTNDCIGYVPVEDKQCMKSV